MSTIASILSLTVIALGNQEVDKDTRNSAVERQVFLLHNTSECTHYNADLTS